MFYPKISTPQTNNGAPQPTFLLPGYNWPAAKTQFGRLSENFVNPLSLLIKRAMLNYLIM